MGMRLVMQEKFGDCGPACLAMVLGCTLQEALDKLESHRSDPKKGTSTSEMVDCLAENGIPALESMVWPSYKVPAILTVPSLNHQGILHFIVWDGEGYLDPSNEMKRYPSDSPKVHGERVDPQWSTAILLWL